MNHDGVDYHNIVTIDDVMDLAHTAPRYIIESCFFTIDKNKEMVPFIFKNLQNQFYEERSIRDDILKGSQFGFSTMILAILTVKFLLVPNSWCVCISHEAEATGRLFEKVKFFLSTMLEPMKQFYIPGTESTSELTNKRMNSKFYIGTAGARAFGRGDTIHYAHLSEISRWQNAGNIATGIIRAVPLNDPKTWIVKETTANGQGNFHHTEWKRERAGLSDFKPHFFPWFGQEEYKLPNVIVDHTTLDDEEQRLVRVFGLDDSRIAWRRSMIRNLPSDGSYTPEDMFRQEFPADENEAFLFSGNPFFPVRETQNYYDRAKDPILVGNLVGISPHEIIDETPHGALRFFDMPSLDGQYCIGADTSSGRNDFGSATVVDKKTWRVVAKYRARIGASQMGDELDRLGRFFNDADLLVEANNMGQSTVDRLIQLQYPHMYKRRVFNKVNQKIMEEYGWWTDTKTKPVLLSFFQDLVRLQQIEIPDKQIIMEMMTYIVKDNGSLGASEGNFDDTVISTALAFFGTKLKPYHEKITMRFKKINSAAKQYRNFRKPRQMGKKNFGFNRST